VKTRIAVIVAVATLAFSSCLSTPSQSGTYSRPEVPPPGGSTTGPAPSANPSGSRTLILNGEPFSEDDVGGFTAWYCKDFSYGGDTLVEVGFFGDPSFNGIGFILYDGGFIGEIISYRREGLDRRWDFGQWGSYAFVIKPDGTGLYYDFTMSKDGTANASDIYECRQR
jgi:hypothetical protein